MPQTDTISICNSEDIAVLAEPHELSYGLIRLEVRIGVFLQLALISQ
jgi:hypothetical protein